MTGTDAPRQANIFASMQRGARIAFMGAALFLAACQSIVPKAPAPTTPTAPTRPTTPEVVQGLPTDAARHRVALLVPMSGGASMAPAAPVAVAQAALAVHASRRTGRLVAQQLLRRRGGQPGALLRRLAERDPVVHHWLLRWPKALEQDLQPLLP